MLQDGCNERVVSRPERQNNSEDGFQLPHFVDGLDLPRRESYVMTPKAQTATPLFFTSNYNGPKSPPTVVTSYPPILTYQSSYPTRRPSVQPVRSSMKKVKPDEVPGQRPSLPSKLSWLPRRRHSRDRVSRHVTFVFPDGHRERAGASPTFASSVSSALASVKKLFVRIFGSHSRSIWSKSGGRRERDIRPELGFHKGSVDVDDVISLHSVRSRCQRRSSFVGSQSFMDFGESSSRACYA